MDVVPARHGKAIRLAAGESVRVVNTHGNQVLDTWAFGAEDTSEFMSMAHFRSVNSRIYPKVGDVFVSIGRRPMLRLVEDTSPGRHDTLLCACNWPLYRELGCREYHRNCQDNLHEALGGMSLSFPSTPAPLNLFMNIPVGAEGEIVREPPVSRPGDHVVLECAMDLVLVFSACPQDITPINGPACEPKDAHFEILRPGAAR